MNVGNVLVFRDEKFGHHRYFEVLGIFLGGLNEESVVEIRSLGDKPASDGVCELPTLFVPECLTRHLEVFADMAALATCPAPKASQEKP